MQQRYVALIDDAGRAEIQAMTGGHGRATRPTDLRLAEEEPTRGFRPLHYFTADTPEDAARYFLTLQDRGCPQDLAMVGDASRNTRTTAAIWRWRGDVHYIKARLRDFRLPDHTEKKVQANPQFRQITSLLGQQCRLYHECRKQDGVAQVPPYQLAPIRQSFAEAEKEVSILGVLLAAAIDAMDAGYRAFGIEHRRDYRLEFGPPPAPAEPEPSAAPEPEPEQHPDLPIKRPHNKQANHAGVK